MSDDLDRPVRADAPRRGNRDEERSSWWELPVLAVVVVVVALVLKAFVVQAFYIPSGSMEQTLLVGDRVLVDKVVYQLRDVRRGEVVVFKGPPSWERETPLPEPEGLVAQARRTVGQVTGLGAAGEEDFIKRVVGVGGDTVACCDDAGHVTVTPRGGQPVALDESAYLYEDDEQPFGPITVPQGRLWMMGDHRGFSSDSRFHTGDSLGGTIPTDNVIGRAFVRIYPLDRLSGLGRPATFERPALDAALPGPVGAPGAPDAAALDAAAAGPPPDRRWSEVG